MSAKSFFRSITNWTFPHLPHVGYVFAVVCVATWFTVGCEDTVSKKPIRYEWKTVMEGDWSSHLYDVHFVNENLGWAVGNAVDVIPGLDAEENAESLIIQTTNGGKTWHRQNSGVLGKPLRKVYFRSALEGWCLGEGGVLIHTSDGGKTWKPIETGTENNLHDFFITETTGWIVGDWGTLLKTTDSGQTFAKVDGRVFNRKSLKGIFFVDENYGWIITYNAPNEKNAGYIYRTTDGGNTWEEQFTTEAALFNLHFIDKQTGWVVGDQRSVYATTDGGQTWQFITDGSNQRHKTSYGQPEYLGKEPLHTFTLYDIDFTDTQNGWIVGDLGVILHTASGGKGKWKHQRGGPRFHNSADAVLLGVDFVSKQLGWVVGEKRHDSPHPKWWCNMGITIESESPLSWRMRYLTGRRVRRWGSRDLSCELKMAVPCGTRRIAARRSVSVRPTLYPHKKGGQLRKAGVVLHTINGGAVWERQASETQQDLLSVFFVDENTGWCVGSGGEIIHTDNGGQTWKRQKSGTTWNLFDVHFTSKRRGWAVGMNGTVLSTVDGGRSWRLASIGERHPFFFLDAVTFVSPEIGWIVGLDLRSLGWMG